MVLLTSPRARRRQVAALGILSLCCAGLAAKPARADTLTIENPGAHPRYAFEAEPHLLLGVIDPPGYVNGTGFGLGFRGSIPIVQDGFVASINNSVAIGFGIDFAHYGRGDYCRADEANINCSDRRQEDGFNEFWFPVVLQWNFFLSRNWSVFGEPGVALNYHSWNAPEDLGFVPFIFFAGGRYHFSEKIALTLRIGYPAFSVGTSFLF